MGEMHTRWDDYHCRAHEDIQPLHLHLFVCWAMVWAPLAKDEEAAGGSHHSHCLAYTVLLKPWWNHSHCVWPIFLSTSLKINLRFNTQHVTCLLLLLVTEISLFTNCLKRRGQARAPWMKWNPVYAHPSEPKLWFSHTYCMLWWGGGYLNLSSIC